MLRTIQTQFYRLNLGQRVVRSVVNNLFKRFFVKNNNNNNARH